MVRSMGSALSLPASAGPTRAGRYNCRMVSESSGVPPAKSRLKAGAEGGGRRAGLRAVTHIAAHLQQVVAGERGGQGEGGAHVRFVG